MTDQFREGLEAAALTIEQEDPGLLGVEFLKALADRVRRLEPQSAALVVSELDDAWGQFKKIYVGVGGFRNPASVTAKGWTAAERVFLRLVKKQKHHTSAILSGTQAFANSHPEAQYVPAPEVFLNQEQFMRPWARAVNGSRNGARESLFDVGRELSGHR